MSTPQYKEPGAIIQDRYKIGTFLGAGGFAAVYRGEDVLIGRKVAIKILNIFASGATPKAQENTLKRFHQEARAAAQIKHPNAVTIYDVGSTEDGHPYMIMDLLEGHDLKHEIEEVGPMVQERIVPLFIRCLEALAEAHRLGIVHKDLKPSNLFLTNPGTDYEQLVILDFGIAGITKGRDARRLTQAGQVLGTPQYMAPEYIESQIISPALDVYQMGLILIEMLSGKMVVDKPDLVTCIMAHTMGNLQLPQELMGSPLGQVVLKALKRKPAERLADADALRRELEKLVVHNLNTKDLLPSRPATGHFTPTTGAFAPTAPTPIKVPVAQGSYNPTRPHTPKESFTPPKPKPPPNPSDWALSEPTGLAGTETPSGQSTLTPPPYNPPIQPLASAHAPQAVHPKVANSKSTEAGCLKAMGIGAVFMTAVVICSIVLLFAALVFFYWVGTTAN